MRCISPSPRKESTVTNALLLGNPPPLGEPPTFCQFSNCRVNPYLLKSSIASTSHRSRNGSDNTDLPSCYLAERLFLALLHTIFLLLITIEVYWIRYYFFVNKAVNAGYKTAINVPIARDCLPSLKMMFFWVKVFRGRQAPPNCYRQSFSRDRPASKISAYWQNNLLREKNTQLW